jgi:hypothetical protein
VAPIAERRSLLRQLDLLSASIIDAMEMNGDPSSVTKQHSTYKSIMAACSRPKSEDGTCRRGEMVN